MNELIACQLQPPVLSYDPFLAEQSSTFLFTNLIERGMGMHDYESYKKSLW